MKNQIKIRQTTFWQWVVPFGLLNILLLFNANAQNRSAVQTLPVYQVTQSRVSDATVKTLTDKFKLPAGALTGRNGFVSFQDTAQYLSIPSKPVTDPLIMKTLKERSVNEIEDAPVRYDAIDFNSIQKLRAPDSVEVIKLASAAFTSAGIHLESAKPVVSHTRFSASYIENGKTIAVDQTLDTRVKYEFYDKSGYPFTGPGAELSATFNAANKISQLHYAWREVKAGPGVKIISEDEAAHRIAKLLPAGAKVKMNLVYWCPPFETKTGKAAPETIIPWYSFTGTVEKRAANGRITQTTTREQIIPATDDPNFIPKVSLKVSGEGTDRLNASVEVTGGHPPYSYTWSGSNPSILSASANAISYQPVVRSESATGTQPSTERVSIIVTDANGISTQVTQAISVIAHISGHTELHGGGPAHGITTYGCESPGEPEEWAKEREGWQQGMANAGGGSQAFCWLGDDSWPGDYIKPQKPGSLPAKPWINGDADYSNWGINTANLVLINGDGWPDGFTAMYPGAPESAYNSSVDLFIPSNGATIVLPIPTNPSYYNVNYNNSWGPVGPNDHLYWLAGLLCDCLDPTDGNGLTPDQRWGPAFGGLHIFTGFASGAAYSAGAFPKAFAENILGVNGPAQTIKDAWFNASTSTSEGAAAAMGPITNGGVSDINDYYVGKGSRGPTISGSAIKGWWYLHQ